MAFDWKQFYMKIDVSNRKSNIHKMYFDAQRKAEEEAYEAWAQKNSVVPTLKGDPDFGPSIVDKMAPRDQTKADYRKYIEAKFHEDEAIKQGQSCDPVPLQSISKTYIDMVTTDTDAANLKKSMDILFPEGEEDGS